MNKISNVLILKALLLLTTFSAFAEENKWPGKKSSFHGFDRYDFSVDEMNCRIVTPQKTAAGKPWIWRARFFGHEPQTDIALLQKGFHVAYVGVADLFGSPKAVARWDAFYKYLTEKHAFSKKPALEGMSRGGLIIYNWAAKDPNKVSCIYADAPVCDFKSWPGPKRKTTWEKCIDAYGLTEDQAMKYDKQPIDNLAPLAKAKIPLLHVVGAADKVVPVAENTAILEKRYKKLGGDITVISKPGIGHHPHSLKNPKPIVDFILKHTGPDSRKKNNCRPHIAAAKIDKSSSPTSTKLDLALGTYYYPWHTGTSFHGGNPPGSTTLRYHLNPRQTPQLGWYDQTKDSVISQHYNWARYAGIDFFVCSYWGRKSSTNTVIKDHMFDNPDRGDIKLCIFLETRITPINKNATVETITDEIDYLCDNYFNHPGYFRIDNKPVIFIYITRAMSDKDLTMCLNAVRTSAANKGIGDVFIVGDEVWSTPDISKKTPRVNQMDAVTNYDVYGNNGRKRFVTDANLQTWKSRNAQWRAFVEGLGKKFVPAISPGYNDRAVRGEKKHPACSRKLNDENGDFGSLFSGMIDRLDPSTEMLMVNSWNEWHEDTQIEPVAPASKTGKDDSPETNFYTQGLEYQGYGKLYLDILRQNFFDKRNPPGRK